MSLWGKIVRRFGKGDALVVPETPRAPAARREEVPSGETRQSSPEAASTDLAAFGARIGEDGGPGVEAILSWVRQHRGTSREGALVRALAESAPRAPEPVRIATAELLAARGEEARALEVLEGAASTPALVLCADLLASAGQMARAITAIERVLAKEIDAPGARERHTRWRSSFGKDPARPGRLDEATIVQPSPDDAPFRILREVARGGAGTVYEAEDELLGRRIAFKVHHSRGDERGAIEREIGAVTSFVGPGVVHLFDASPGKGWVALEWVPRGSLRDLLRRGDVGWLGAPKTWMTPLALALARLHRRGWVHGDVKPANVLLRSPTDPVLGDFGLARAVGGVSDGGGSPGYVSPERLGGGAVDPRDDVYGFGRIVEDVIDALGAGENRACQPGRPEAGRVGMRSGRATGEAGSEATNDARRVAEACMLPGPRRPADADAVLALLTAG